MFQEAPGRIRGYQLRLKINDKTLYCQRGWPEPLRYQEAIGIEIEWMIEIGVIKRESSLYINSIVTVIKKDDNVILCLDARRINAVTIPDHKGAVLVNEVLASCRSIKVI